MRLVLLAPLFGQVLIGAKQPAEWLQPPVFIAGLWCYGCGALLAHELAYRLRREGEPVWPRMLRLAAAFGLAVNGVMLKLATSGDWTRLGPLADTQHGHYFGFNLTWTLAAVVHYVVLAVMVPVLWMELRRPDLRDRPWLSERKLKWLLRAFIATIVLGALTPSSTPFWALAVVIALTLWVYWGARRWSPRPARPLPPVPPWRIGLAAALLTIGLPLVLLIVPVGPPNLFNLIAVPGWFIGLSLLTWYVARRTARRVAGGWSPRHNLALLSGIVVPLALLALCQGQGADAYHIEHPAGMMAFGVAVLWALWRLRRHVRAQEEPTAPAANPSDPETDPCSEPSPPAAP